MEPVILLVDDNEEILEFISEDLESKYTMLTATDGKKALDILQKESVQLVISDIMMPEIDGWQVLQTLRAVPETATIPVIICSVFNDPQLAYSLGASLFISKPVSRKDLLAALHRLNVVS